MQSAGVVYELSFPALIGLYFDPEGVGRRATRELGVLPEEFSEYMEGELQTAQEYFNTLPRFFDGDSPIIHPACVSVEIIITHALLPMAAYARYHGPGNVFQTVWGIDITPTMKTRRARAIAEESAYYAQGVN